MSEFNRGGMRKRNSCFRKDTFCLNAQDIPTAEKKLREVNYNIERKERHLGILLCNVERIQQDIARLSQEHEKQNCKISKNDELLGEKKRKLEEQEKKLAETKRQLEKHATELANLARQQGGNCFAVEADRTASMSSARFEQCDTRSNSQPQVLDLATHSFSAFDSSRRGGIMQRVPNVQDHHPLLSRTARNTFDTDPLHEDARRRRSALFGTAQERRFQDPDYVRHLQNMWSRWIELNGKSLTEVLRLLDLTLQPRDNFWFAVRSLCVNVWIMFTISSLNVASFRKAEYDCI